MNKIIGCILAISVLGLVSCSDKDEYQRQVTFTGGYLPVIQGKYQKDGFTYRVSATQTTITCPPGYSINKQLPLPVFGTAYYKGLICNRQGGCEYYNSVLNSSGLIIEKKEIAQTAVALTYANLPTSISAGCYKESEINDYIIFNLF